MRPTHLHTVPRAVSRGLIALACMFAGLFGPVVPAKGQAPVSDAARLAHSTIVAYEGPVTCMQCHAAQANEMFGSVHYQEMGPTPNVANIPGLAGKGRNGGMVMNSYCGTPVTSPRATCSSCHVGNGQSPSTTLSADQLTNIDCMMCHQDAYKRVPAGPLQTITMPGTNGSQHTIQAPVETESGFRYAPDEAHMSMSILQAARTVHLPTRASCLRCHATAGGSDGGKRGDLSSITANPPLASDVHMSPQGANQVCADCHAAGNHRVRGRGVDLRPNDSSEPLTCGGCHSDRPHGDFSLRVGSSRDRHAMRVACQTCHIPKFAKDKSTEMQRDWTVAHFSPTACRGQGGWIPSEVRASNVTPIYRWFDGTSIAHVLGQPLVQTAPGDFALALPNGSVTSAGAKLYPMKLHRSNSARHDATGQLIPHSTFSYFTSGDFALAVQSGRAQSGLTGPATLVNVHEYQTINHGVEPATNALRCGACHAGMAGGPVRMDLKSLGYTLKASSSVVCVQCHGNEDMPGFTKMHAVHVQERGFDCAKCHNFSRTELAVSPPAIPAGLAALAGNQRVTLTWSAVANATSYSLKRSLYSGGPYTSIAAGLNLTTYSDTAVTNGTSYFYAVSAANSAGQSANSAPVSATPRATVALPLPPSSLKAEPGDRGSVKLEWKQSTSPDILQNKVYRASINGGPYVLIATLSARQSYINTGLTRGKTYFFVVTAINRSGVESKYSNQASAMTR